MSTATRPVRTRSCFNPTPTSFVFSAGTIGWSRALSEPDLVNVALQRVTQNILARARLFPFANAVPSQRRSDSSGSLGQSEIIAGSGSAGNVDDAALVAQFDAPAGVAPGLNGELYVCDTGNQLIRKISADGQVSTLLGTGSSSSVTKLDTPTGIAVDANGVVYVSDTNTDRIVAIDPQGKASVFAGGSAGNRDAANPLRARFDGPRGLAFDSSGALYVADLRNDAIRRVDRSGVSTVVTRAGGPSAIAIGPDGTLYYVATWNGANRQRDTGRHQHDAGERHSRLRRPNRPWSDGAAATDGRVALHARGFGGSPIPVTTASASWPSMRKIQ